MNNRWTVKDPNPAEPKRGIAKLLAQAEASSVMNKRASRYEFVELTLVATTNTGGYPPGLPIRGWLITPPKIGRQIHMVMHNLMQRYSLSEAITCLSAWPGSRSTGFLTQHSAYLLQFVDEPPTADPRCERCRLPLLVLPLDESGHICRVCPLGHKSHPQDESGK
jgi:hypothetical protein